MRSIRCFLPLILTLFLGACSIDNADMSSLVHMDKSTHTCLSKQGNTLPEYFCTSTCENPVKNNDKLIVWIDCFTQNNPKEFLYKNALFDGISIMLTEDLTGDIKYTETEMNSGVIQKMTSFNFKNIKISESFFVNGNEIASYSYYPDGKIFVQTKIYEDGKESAQMYYINENIAREFVSINDKISEMKVYDINGSYKGTFSLEDSKKFPSVFTENKKLESL